MSILNVVGFLTVRIEFTQVNYWQVISSQNDAIFLSFGLFGFYFTFFRIYGLFFFFGYWLIASPSRFVLCSSSASISAISSRLRLFGRVMPKLSVVCAGHNFFSVFPVLIKYFSVQPVHGSRGFCFFFILFP